MKMFKLKVTLFLEGGQKLTFKCRKFEITKLSLGGDREMSYEGAKLSLLTVDVKKIIAVKAKRCLFFF